MQQWAVWMIAAAGMGVSLFLWFRDVRRIMRGRKSTLESAASQLAFSRKRAVQMGNDPDAAAVLERSERIYSQAVDIYNRTLQRPWVYLPARLMRFEPVSGKEVLERRRNLRCRGIGSPG